ncbi:MAG TPA: HD domain-containing protein, partial [Methanocella sp.]|nr:HD domain-containing protein [Methanocella sp.]
DNRAFDSSLFRCAAKNSFANRRRADTEDIRRPYFHDGDRIMHSGAYARYIDKTQVFYLIKNDHITHRVLHVQLVSKIARMIGRGLLLNEDLIEAIALGHDIGHAPYGHDGEQYLAKVCKKHGLGGFRHNVQSVRALDRIEDLNLTLQVLDGILAHNGEAHDRMVKPVFDKTWEAFDEETEACERTSAGHSGVLPMTLEGCVVRVSDTISFIGRDIEDAITIRLIARGDIPRECAEVLGNNNRDIVNNLVIDVIENSYGLDHIALSQDTADALKRLREFNDKMIYNNPKIKSEAGKVERMFAMLFETFLEALEEGDHSSRVYRNYLDTFAPEKLKNYLDRTSNARIVRDFIAGMTDDYFNDTFRDMYLPQKRNMY